jgi:hypothetical protein
VVLRETAPTRLVFRPELVDNPNDMTAAVRGTFIYQRKSPKETWEDTATIPLSTLKTGEGYKLELKAAEVLNLVGKLTALYKMHAKGGIPIGVTELVPVDAAVAKLLNLRRHELQTFFSAHEALGARLLATLLDWAAGLHEPAALVPRLLALGPEAFRNLNVAMGLGRLKQALETWESNADNGDEEFWQRILTDHAFVLEQVFAWPTMIVKDKAYVGGKSIMNTGGSIVDFLVKNYLTTDAALVEIKTPATALLAAAPYRGGVYNVSADLGGAVMQVLSYRAALVREFQSLRIDGLEAFAPRCVVIVGTTAELADNDDTMRSFELYRSSVASTVTILTFDEVFEKTRRLVQLLETAS